MLDGAAAPAGGTIELSSEEEGPLFLFGKSVVFEASLVTGPEAKRTLFRATP